MTNPRTKLDERFSGAGATATSWPDTLKVLESAELFWVTTVRAGGQPHVTPLVAAWVQDALYFTTGSGEQKDVNLQANPHVVLTTGCNSWESGLDVVVEGRAVRVTDPEILRRLVPAWAAKWDGRWQLTAGPDGVENTWPGVLHAYQVRPTRVFAHAKGDPFGATTHRF
ncbi:MAG TPA: pyridoxamine 5'-phosphate oxidase family protein [Streptosporangiaceae bacterium]|jgi:general stress protein 26